MINIINEVSRCLLCNDAPCTKACPKGLDPARGIRALFFEDNNAAPSFIDADDCVSCSAPCEEACIHYDFPIRIKNIAAQLGPKSSPGRADLSIDFCGVHCENPFFLASSVIANNYDMIAKAFDMGWGGRNSCNQYHQEHYSETSQRGVRQEDNFGIQRKGGKTHCTTLHS